MQRRLPPAVWSDDASAGETAAGVRAALSERFRLARGRAAADLITPAVRTLAFCVAGDEDAVFSVRRDAAAGRVLAMARGFRDSYVLAVARGEAGFRALSELQTAVHDAVLRAGPGDSFVSVPSFVFVGSADAAAATARTFAQHITREGTEAMAGQVDMLWESQTSRAAAVGALAGVPGVACEEGAAEILLDVFGSVRAVAAASRRELLLRAPVSRDVAEAVSEFFRA